MFTKLSYLLPFALLTSPLAASAASSQSQEQEYQQVRKIALRDPKVRAAYAEADQRLKAKILQIDPALKGYVQGRSDQPSGPLARNEVVPAPKRSPAKPAVAAAPRTTHVIAAGETLSTIAARYDITVADLKAANPKVNEKRLQVGEKLTLPSAPRRVAKSEPKKLSAWERLKSQF